MRRQLSLTTRKELIEDNFGYGIGDDMDSLLAKYVGE
jgi:hypothetical protein